MNRDPTTPNSEGEQPAGSADETAASQRRGQPSVSAAAVGIVAVDQNGIICSCNPAAEKLLGRSASTLLGRPLGFPTSVDQAYDIDLALPDGSARTVEMRVSSTTWNGQPLFITALHDPDSTQFDVGNEPDVSIAVTAHELGKPLAAVDLAVHQLRHDTILTTEQAALVDRIDERTRHMQALVRQLRTASRIDAQQTHVTTEPVPLFEFLLERLHELHKLSQDVRLSCPAGVVVDANRNELAQIVDNYLSNALTHGRPPVHVHVSALPRGWVTIRVYDHGPGVPAHFQPRLFKRFARLTSTQQQDDGTGLGLWITRNLARAHGGEAWYEPHNAHGGACFCVRLPAWTPPMRPQPQLTQNTQT